MVKRTDQDEKISFALFAFEVQVFQLAKFSYSETNQTSLLSHVDVSRGLKKFYKMAAPQLYQAQEKIDLSIFSKPELSSFRLVFACDSFSLEL